MNDTSLPTTQSEAASPNVPPAFVCACGEFLRSACQGEPFFREHEGKQYCVLHYPGTDKVEAFRLAFNRKLEAKDFDFKGLWFPEFVDFHGFEFSADANFSFATFSRYADFVGTIFSADADFRNATFSVDVAEFIRATFNMEAKFRNATFGADANFGSATFKADVDFYNATFGADADFQNVTFSSNAGFQSATFCTNGYFHNTAFSIDADFSCVMFSVDAYFYNASFGANADFGSTTFKNYVNFAGSAEQRNFGKQARLDFQFAHIEKNDRVSFHTLDLKPHWFINCDCRKFEFTDCDWSYSLSKELEEATKVEISAPHRLLAITFRQLADNAEANHRYSEAIKFRYNSLEVLRIEKFRGFVPWRLDWWYWLASGYGESVLRAFLVFLAILILFSVLFMQVGFDQSAKNTTTSSNEAGATQSDTVGKPLKPVEAFIYSASVSVLQKPEPKPFTPAAKTLVLLETVLGSAQAAMLALAVRRRFMR